MKQITIGEYTVRFEYGILNCEPIVIKKVRILGFIPYNKTVWRGEKEFISAVNRMHKDQYYSLLKTVFNQYQKHKASWH